MKKGPQDIFGVVLTHPKRSQELTHPKTTKKFICTAFANILKLFFFGGKLELLGGVFLNFWNIYF
jgi:hypothetical protein